ncbi:hypothetical protein FACS189490_11520 [Clostridia bacterium]|nr:hypothetical protein FACS189490_11520 [Clostridia bacterium]
MSKKRSAKEEKNRKEAMNALSLITQLGVSMVIAVLIGVLAGNALDGWLHTSPLFLFIFIVIGVGAAFINLYKLTITFWKKTDDITLEDFSTKGEHTDERRSESVTGDGENGGDQKGGRV